MGFLQSAHASGMMPWHFRPRWARPLLKHDRLVSDRLLNASGNTRNSYLSIKLSCWEHCVYAMSHPCLGLLSLAASKVLHRMTHSAKQINSAFPRARSLIGTIEHK